MSASISIVPQKSFSVLIVIDTIAIRKKYLKPNFDEFIKIDIDDWFVITSADLTTKQEKPLNAVLLQNSKGSSISFYGISIDAGTSDTIILNKVEHLNSKKEILKPFEINCESQKTMTTVLNDDNKLVTMLTNQNFIWFESMINEFGKEKLKVSFTLYNLSRDGNQQDFYGRFWFILNIKTCKFK